MNSIMSERPRCCRNLTSAFDAVAAEAELELEAPELSENRENLFVEELLNADRDRFKERWGYDPKEDKPVEGSNWEYELIHPPSRPQGEAAVEQGTAEENTTEGANKNEKGSEVDGEGGKDNDEVSSP